MKDAYVKMWNPLVRYVVAATLARGADGGAAVGLVLLAVDPAVGLEHGARVGGLLAVGLTAPHLLGPWVARLLDRARDGRLVLAAFCLTFGLAIAAASLLFGRAPAPAVAVLVAIAGACGPMLTGGLSSRLAGIASDERRAEGWDAVTYGIGGTAGPAVVAALAGLFTPLAAMLALAGAAVAAAAVTLTLPRECDPTAAGEGGLPVRAVLRLLVACGPLRRVGVVTLLTALSLGALGSVIAVVFGSTLTSRPGAGAALAAAFGLGNLAGSLLVTAFPLRGEPETMTARFALLMSACLALCAIAPSYPSALIAFFLAGASNAPFFTATLAARSRYSPSEARAQVFVSMAATKVAMASAGTALAGAAIGLGPRPLLAAGAAITLTGASTAVLDRRLAATPRSA